MLQEVCMNWKTGVRFGMSALLLSAWIPVSAYADQVADILLEWFDRGFRQEERIKPGCDVP